MRIALALLAAAGGIACAAENLVEARDGTVVRVSATEPNLIEASEGRITAFVFADDAFDASSDPESGVVYFRPLQDGPRSGFVEYETAAGERKRVSLVLVAQSGEIAQRIVVQAEGFQQVQPAEQAPVPVALPRNQSLKRLLRQLADSSLAVSAVPEQVALELAGGVELNIVASTFDGGWEAQIGRIENRADAPAAVSFAAIAMLVGRTVAVASEVDSLAARESATVYLVREASATGLQP